MKVHHDSNEMIDSYLADVGAGLSDLPGSQVAEILAELRSHILDRSRPGGQVTEVGVRTALDMLGPPKELAAIYCSEFLMARAEKSHSPWLILRTLFGSATRSAWAFAASFICCCGYLIGLGALACAILKPFYPGRDGLWWNTQTHTFAIGLIWPEPTDSELLGWWMVPIGLVASLVIFVLITGFARWNIRSLRRFRRTARSAFRPVSFKTQDSA